MKATTIAAAEKRTVKHEISTLNRALKKLRSDFRKEHRKSAAAMRKLELHTARLSRSEIRESAAITRRLAILSGRLHS